MKLSQLRCILEVHRHGNHISAAAEALHTSQPGVSKQIQMLEAEIGFPVFQRKRNRVTGLTEPGREVIEIAQRIMGDVENLRTLRDDYLDREKGTLTIATTHTYARYVLPRVIERFIKRYPDVHLGLQQGNPTQICEAVEAEQADIAVVLCRDDPVAVELELEERGTGGDGGVGGEAEGGGIARRRGAEHGEAGARRAGSHALHPPAFAARSRPARRSAAGSRQWRRRCGRSWRR